MLGAVFPIRGLDSVEPQTRTSRLYLIACARRLREQLPGVCRAVSRAAECLYAAQKFDRALRDSLYPHAEALIHCRGDAVDVNAIGRALASQGHADAAEVWATEDVPPDEWAGFAYLVFAPFSNTTPNFQRIPKNLHSAELVREIFGDPFAFQPPFQGAWRTDNVLRLARHVESTLDFSVMPILADALQEDGCTREDILDHLRRGGPHERGCWALEKVLARGD